MGKSKIDSQGTYRQMSEQILYGSDYSVNQTQLILASIMDRIIL